MKKYHKVLTIAGSDSGGGAGIQADLKTIAACGCYGASAITALTAQNTLGVFDVFPVSMFHLQRQIEVVLDDIGADAIKIGMLHNSEVIRTVRATLDKYSLPPIVIDPVMVATSGDKLLQDEAIETLKNVLFPLATVITPNLPEAEELLGQKINSAEEMPAAARALSMNGKISVLLKAGHLTTDTLTDIFFNATTNEILPLTFSRITTRNTHGTGCSLSSALAAFLAKGLAVNDAIVAAKTYIDGAIRGGAGYELGKGHGAVHHFYQWW